MQKIMKNSTHQFVIKVKNLLFCHFLPKNPKLFGKKIQFKKCKLSQFLKFRKEITNVPCIDFKLTWDISDYFQAKCFKTKIFPKKWFNFELLNDTITKNLIKSEKFHFAMRGFQEKLPSNRWKVFYENSFLLQIGTLVTIPLTSQPQWVKPSNNLSNAKFKIQAMHHTPPLTSERTEEI